MSKLVVLQISENLNENFWVNLKISSSDNQPFVQVGGELPLAQDAIEQYKKWRKNYQQLSYFIKFKTKVDTFTNSLGIEIDNYVKRQQQRCYQEFLLLQQEINNWLEAPNFKHITKILTEQLTEKEEILFFISTSSVELKQLPWHLWKLLEKYPAAEIILGNQNEVVPNSLSSLARKNLKILAIINNVKEPDLSQYKQELVNKLPAARITFLSEAKSQEINNYLRKRSWDILFFNNSSKPAEYQKVFDNKKSNTNINIDSIRYGLKIAKNNGLKLAIFNSHNSWEGFSRLEKIEIPNIIVMREVISERIAQKFFNYFLEDFTTNNSLHLAVRAAREKLKKVETIFFDASWFPVIYQNCRETKNVLAPKEEVKTSKESKINPTPIPHNGKAGTALLNGKTGINYIKVKPKKNLVTVANKIGDRPEAKIPETSKKETAKIAQKITEEEPLIVTTTKKEETKELNSNNSKTWNKFHLIWLVALIFIGTKAYTLAISFILVRFVENSHENLQVTNVNRSPQTLQANPNYQKKSQFKDVKKVPSGIFRYGGSASWGKIRHQVHPEILKIWPDFKIVYTEHPREEGNSDTAIEMLLDFQLSFVETSRPLKKEEYQEALNKKLELEQVPIAIDAIVFAVNPELNISGLTLTQLKDIYTGKITNWQELGGPDLTIIPYSKSPLKSGTAEFFKENILDNNNLGQEVSIVTNVTETLQKVDRNKGAIFYASASHIVGQCRVKSVAIGRSTNNLISPYQEPLIPASQCPDRRNQLNHSIIQNSSYPLSRYLYVIVKKNGLFDRLAGEAYVNLLISRQGQELIEDSGFVPIH